MIAAKQATPKLERGDFAAHIKSGNVYHVIDADWALTHDGKVGCTGWRDGKEFGPIRFIARAALAKVQA